ncbi:DUF6479 family protein [Streptomyces sp. NPDC051907]|uniref:DUF6479 family protein n=1 Tax=Streptomyces sp. NPDC051907 TaxID=3155284 RepID=UPI0034140E55
MNGLIYAQIDQLAEPVAQRSVLASVAPVVIGVILVLLLFAVAMWANRRRSYEPPRPEEQPHHPDHQSHEEGPREPDDFGYTGDRRILPHEMKGYGNFGTRPVVEKPPGDQDKSGDQEKSGGAVG